MAKARTNRSGSSMTWVWMLGALLVVGVFLVWLGLTAEPSVIETPVVEDSTPMQMGATGTPVEASELETNAAAYTGQQIEVTANAIQKMGDSFVLLSLPSGGGFLVKAPQELLAVIQTPTNMTFVGTVMSKTDALVTEWESIGLLSGTDVLIARTGTLYLDAVDVRPPGA